MSSSSDFDIAIEPLIDVEQLGAIWRDLEARAAPSFFLSWHWIGTWLLSIDLRPEVLAVRSGGRVVGLGLLHVRRTVRRRFLPIRTLYLNQTGDQRQDVVTMEYNDILAEPAIRDRVRAACLSHLLRSGRVNAGRFDEIALGGLHEGLFTEIGRLGRPLRELASAGSALVDLGAIRAAGGAYLDQLSGNTRHQLRRAMTLYGARGELALHAAGTVEEALAFFDQAGLLHQERWTERGRPGAFAYPFYVAFHRRLIRTAWPAGAVELVRVTAGEEPIGYVYNFLHRGRVYYYFSGFRYEADNRLKPGMVSHCLCIERHLRLGMDVYDFMGGDNRYKTSLGRLGPRIVSVAIERPHPLLAAERPLRRLKQAVADHRLQGLART